MIDYLVSHYVEVLGIAAMLLAGLLNLVTPHPDKVSQPVLKALAVALDIVSWLQSRQSHPAMRGPLARLKVPGQMSPPVDIFRREPTR